MLARAEKFARTAQLEIFVRDFEAVGCRLHDLHTPLRRVIFGVRDENAGGFILPAPDSSSELVELREPEPLGVFYNHYHGVRHVYADLDDRRRDKQLRFALGKRLHNFFLVRALHLAVHQPNRVTAKIAALQFIGVFHGGGEFRVALTLVNERTDYIPLSPRVEVLFDIVICPLPQLRSDGISLNSLPAWRQLIEN